MMIWLKKTYHFCERVQVTSPMRPRNTNNCELQTGVWLQATSTSHHNQQWVFNDGTILDSMHEVIRRESVRSHDSPNPNYAMGTFHQYMPAPTAEEIEMNELTPPRRAAIGHAPSTPRRHPQTQLSSRPEVSRAFTFVMIT